MSDYMPAEDAQFSLWAQAFATGITNDPAKYMMTAAEAASIQSVVDDFVAALLVATNEETRTSGTIATKDDKRSICETLCRQYAMFIKENTGIIDEDKINIGVRPINPDREPIDAPSTQPLLNVLGNIPGTQSLRYSDFASPDSRSKPFGVSSLVLFLGVGAEEALPQSDCAYYGNFTKNPIAVDFTEDQDGQIATYYGRWMNPKGELGPWSLPVSMRIAA